jgi:hypothetical protein
MPTSTETDLTATARGALQIVCSSQLDRLPEFYDEDFVDHVNAMTFAVTPAPASPSASTARCSTTCASRSTTR